MNADDDRTAADGGTGEAPAAGSDPRLDALRKRLDEEKKREEARRGLTRGDGSAMAQALKYGSEFVAGVIVGFVIGYGIDQLLGTRPWGMIVFLLLGFAAGTMNVLRAAGVMAEPDNRKGASGGDEGTGPPRER